MARPRPLDTIAAVATAPGRGGIGVVRISGPAVSDIARAIVGRAPSARHAAHIRFLNEAGELLDDGIALYFPGPHSYTGEDVLELQGHGGPVVLQMLLERCIALGARHAEPGEFTRRAFLNDKMDLAQAEAVADLIDAETAAAARSAARSLSGEFSRVVAGLVDKLVELRMLVEATLDFPEEEEDFLASARAAPRLEELHASMEAVQARARQGSLLRRGLTVVIAGRPNVGKSSLLNQLMGEDRAIVTPIPGTTRDVLRETIQVGGIPLHVIDTAGLRATDDQVERIGIERTWREIEGADVILHLVDVRDCDPGGQQDLFLVGRMPPGVERILVRNKCDLALMAASSVREQATTTVTLSAKTGEGIDLLRQELLRVAGWKAGGEDAFLARERHLAALDSARLHLTQAVAQRGELELLAEELRLAQEALSQIVGEFTADDLLGEIFSRFCIGK